MSAKLKDIRVGDSITFRSLTRYSNEKATRIVKEVPPKGKWMHGYVAVRYAGYGDFYVRLSEIIEHHPLEEPEYEEC
jgi:hypothetical protein